MVKQVQLYGVMYPVLWFRFPLFSLYGTFSINMLADWKTFQRVFEFTYLLPFILKTLTSNVKSGAVTV